jgi:hypothetical protein
MHTKDTPKLDNLHTTVEQTTKIARSFPFIPPEHIRNECIKQALRSTDPLLINEAVCAIYGRFCEGCEKYNPRSVERLQASLNKSNLEINSTTG